MKKSKIDIGDDEGRDIYSSEEYREELEDDDEISIAEQGFMEGYIEA